MLEPRESDIPALFLVLVVLPLVAYILLGKWSESAKKRNRITLLAQLAAEEALRAEEMAVGDVVPLVSSSKSGLHACARCSAPAKTRCSRCKSIRYCSGNCQIIHWRQVHKHECQQLEIHKSTSSPQRVSVDESYGSGLLYENMNTQFFGHNLKQTKKEKAPSDNLVHPPIGTGESASADCDLLYSAQASTIERKTSCKSNSEMWRRDNGTIYDSSIESSGYNATSSPSSTAVTKDRFRTQKSRNEDYVVLEEETINKVNAGGCNDYIRGQDTSRSRTLEVNNYQSHQSNAFTIRSNPGGSSPSNAVNNDETVKAFEAGISTKGGNTVVGGNCHSDEAPQLKCFPEMTVKGSIKGKKISRPPKTKCSKSPKSSLKTLGDLCCPGIEKKGQITNESKVAGVRDTIPSQGGNGAASTGIMKMMGLRRSVKHSSVASTENSGEVQEDEAFRWK